LQLNFLDLIYCKCNEIQVIQQIPWESMSALDSTPISRVPSLYILLTLALKHGFNKWSSPSSPPSLSLDLRLQKKSNIDVNPKLAFYVLNPGQDLPGVQQRLQPILEDIWGKQSGVIGTIPVEQEIKKSLTDRDVFL
jgi:Peptidase family C50